MANDPEGNVQHIAEHGLTQLDVEHVLHHPQRRTRSRTSQRLMIFGRTVAGEAIAVVCEEIDESTVYPVTAYSVEE